MKKKISESRVFYDHNMLLLFIMNVMNNILQKHMQEHQQVVDSIGGLESSIEKAAMIMVDCLKDGGTIFWCANGGSSNDSQHLAAELIGRYNRVRRLIRSLPFTADSSVITCFQMTSDLR